VSSQFNLQVGVVIAWLFPAWHIVCIDLVRMHAIARSLHPMRELTRHAQHRVCSQIGRALRCMIPFMHDTADWLMIIPFHPVTQSPSHLCTCAVQKDGPDIGLGSTLVRLGCASPCAAQKERSLALGRARAEAAGCGGNYEALCADVRSFGDDCPSARVPPFVCRQTISPLVHAYQIHKRQSIARSKQSAPCLISLSHSLLLSPALAHITHQRHGSSFAFAVSSF
jgi:hypothetical protein